MGAILDCARTLFCLGAPFAVDGSPVDCCYGVNTAQCADRVLRGVGAYIPKVLWRAAGRFEFEVMGSGSVCPVGVTV